MKKFRNLKAEEIDCRIGTINEKGLSLLLYKDARCDMNILDETVGEMNWQRKHLRDNANCIIEIWDDDKKQWISKEDTGTESFSEAEKGLASDSFKRAGFNWGIGRELYTAPFIWISKDECKITTNSKGKPITYDKFYVKEINCNKKGEIETLVIVNQNKKVVFTTKKKETKKKETKEDKPKEEKIPERTKLIMYCKENKINMIELANKYNLTGKSTEEEFKKVLLEIKENK